MHFTSLPVCATFPTHHIPNDSIILVIFSKEFKFEACHHIFLATFSKEFKSEACHHIILATFRKEFKSEACHHIILATFSKEFKSEACHHIILSTLLGTNLLFNSKFSSHKCSCPHTTMGSIMVLHILHVFRQQ